MPSARIEDHAQTALDRLAPPLNQAPGVAGLVEAFAARIQGLEDAADGCITDRMLDSAPTEAPPAVNVLFDQYGEIVGEPRQGLEDADYARFLKIRLLLNRSSGEISRLRQVVRLATGASRVRLFPLYPAEVGFEFWVSTALTSEASAKLAARIKDGLAAGVRLATLGQVLTDGGVTPFGFAEDPEAGGFSDDTVLQGTIIEEMSNADS